MQNIKKQPTKTQRFLFYSFAFVGTLGTLRNIWRMSRKAKQYVRFNRVASNQDDLNEVLSILEGGNAQKQVILQSILPNFKEKYFQPAQDFKKFKSMRGNFYQNLELQGPFEGYLTAKKKEYKIEFIMNHPKVSTQLVNMARSMDERGSKFNKTHSVATYGCLRYLQNKKKIVFDTKMIGFDGLSMVKYFQIHIISILLSTFFYSILLGAAFAIYLNRDVFDQKILQNWLSSLFQSQPTPEPTIQKNPSEDDSPV